MKKIYLVVINLFIIATHLQGQDSPIHGRAAESFPYPFKKLTFLNARFDRVIHNDDSYVNSYILRGVTTIGKQFHLRADAVLANSNSSGVNQFGLGDMNIRLVHASRIHQRLYWGYGLQNDFPTATHESLGTGKFVARPNTGLAYFRGKSTDDVTGTMMLGVEYRFSYAGDGSRNDISQLALSPNIDWWFKKWYMGYYATWLYNFKSDVFDLPLDIEAGYAVIPHLTFAAEYILPLLKDAGYKYEFTLKLRYDF